MLCHWSYLNLHPGRDSNPQPTVPEVSVAYTTGHGGILLAASHWFPRRGMVDESSESLLHGAQSIEATPPPRRVIDSGRVSVLLVIGVEVSLVFRHRRC